MGLVFHLICLFFTLFVLQSYVSSGFHAREHRLLPLVLGLIALNSFYRITYYVTGEAKTLRILTDLLAIHMLYLMIHYVGDFMKFQLKLGTEVILFCSLVLFNSMLIIRAAQRETYQDAFRIALLCYTGILLGLATYVRVKSEVSVWEGHVNDMLYLGMALPGVAMLFRAVTPKAEEFLVPGAFEISCLIVFYLMMTGRLSNVTNIIRENFYNISDIPTFLFDNRMRYRDANASARRWFPKIVGELTDDPQEYPFYTKMMRWSKDPDQDYVVQWKESYCRCQLHPVCSENVVRGYILTLLDITQQKKETVLMEDLKKKAEEQSFLKSRFLASVSHDLRSPLHAIIGGSDILKRQNLPDESKNILEYIRVAGNNLLEQVDTILAYSKLEAGMLTLKDKTYNFYEMIEEQARLCLLNIREKDIVFTVRFLDRFPEQVSGDYLRVAQIFQNILSNACKFTEQGTITLSLHCKMEEGQVWFDGCVEDTGVGMTKEKLAQVFAEYVSFSEDMGVEGFGLGLSIVRQLVEMMHGWVRAESDPGKGTRVSFGFYQKQVPTEISEPRNIGREILKEQSDPQVEEADEAGFRNRNSGKIQGTSESGRCVKEGESHRTEERCEYPHAGILLERGGEFTSETSGICPEGSAYVSDKSSWNQRYQPPDWKRGDCPAGRNYGDGGKDRKPCLYKPESAYLLRAAAGDGERNKTGDQRFTGEWSHTSAGKTPHDG